MDKESVDIVKHYHLSCTFLWGIRNVKLQAKLVFFYAPLRLDKHHYARIGNKGQLYLRELQGEALDEQGLKVTSVESGEIVSVNRVSL